MARRQFTNRDLKQLIQLVSRLPRGLVIGLIVLAGVGYLIYHYGGKLKRHDPAATAGPPGSYLFCSWNVENFYDDADNPAFRDEKEDYFAANPDMFAKKVDHLADGLLTMNGGAGPDIVALVEVESLRCFEALRDALNAKLDSVGMADKKYEHILFVGDNTGRRSAPGILTRLPVVADRTRKLGKRGNGRILEGHITVNGHDLAVIAAHWTSRATDEVGDKGRRLSYAQDCYGRVRAILTENPVADVIVCGDFNDEFKDASMQEGLMASSDADAVKTAAEPKVLDVFAHWAGDPAGTHFYEREWAILDHICLTRGLLDANGWAADPATASIHAPKEFRIAKTGAPLKFGDVKAPSERGFSDHFPVVVRLTVAGAP